ncbi:MAG: hypothetical protein KA271_01725 [Propionivibrio sp.]|nr:hypothetical protein [Propionivibrio sp.]
MCYGCELKSTLGEKTMEEYLDIRCDYGVMNAQMTELLNRMLSFEKTITDREQRKAWHATRKRVLLAKKLAGEAMSHVRPNIDSTTHPVRESGDS